LLACTIHAHFYQPPREDPITGKIPFEKGAAPYDNWNERIHAECYRPNAELRNFEQISFDIGPTLSIWLQASHPGTHSDIVKQDHTNVSRRGVGNAMAQAYNHTILPLSGYQDKMTQVYWGVADFVHRFGRRPQGMWLPETAVDNETLEVLALHGITHTILAPWQAEEAQIDPSEPYLVNLPDKRHITVFFYHGELSAKVSFDPLVTINADTFAQEFLRPHFSSEKNRRGDAEMLLIASDGELYGHHQMQRERFLAHLLNGASSQLGVLPTYPGLWLQAHPARKAVTIRENTSWSCHHGIDRWTGLCPCTPGFREWKVNLRQAFNRLGEELDRLYLEVARPLVGDPWLLRQRYIHFILSELTIDELFSEMSSRALRSEDSRRLHLMLEAQRERQRMFTSCGWFFEDFDRIEPKNNVAYAAQAVRLAYLASGVDLEAATVSSLDDVISPRSGLRGGDIFRQHMSRAKEFRSEQVGYAD
jgi:hypothetical protein